MGAAFAIIGCGNPNRCDDGAGLEVVRLLREARPELGRAVRLLDAGTDGMGVMFAARGCDGLIIVDACLSGAEPGTIFEVPGDELAAPPRRSFTLHDFRWDHALHAGREMFKADFPASTAVFLIEAQRVDFGIGLLPPVAAAASRVAAIIAERVRAACADAAPSPETRSAPISYRDGRLYFAKDVCEAQLGAGCAALLRDGPDLLVLPVRHAAAGGHILKLRNSAGDRVITAPDFFRGQGVGEAAAWAGESAWAQDRAALVLIGFFER